VAKYDALREELSRDGRPRKTMTFAEVAKLVGTLPPSAFTHEGWWANEDHHTTRHVQCKAWGQAGYRATVDWDAQRVTFTRR
jgi:hypothetical protein